MGLIYQIVKLLKLLATKMQYDRLLPNRFNHIDFLCKIQLVSELCFQLLVQSHKIKPKKEGILRVF